MIRDVWGPWKKCSYSQLCCSSPKMSRGHWFCLSGEVSVPVEGLSLALLVVVVLPARRPFPPSRTASQSIFYWEQAVAHLWSVRLDGCRWAQELASEAKPSFVIAFHLPALTHPGQWKAIRELARRVNTWFTDGFKGLYVFEVVRRAGLRAGQIIRAPESVYASSQTSLWKFSL